MTIVFVAGLLLLSVAVLAYASGASWTLSRRRRATRLVPERAAGSYELVERLAHGGMGEVWRAEHRLLVRPAAVKIIRPEMLGAASAEEARALLRRFEREAQTTAILSSPHTIDLFDFGLTRDGAFYYVMELLVGRDLQSLVREFGPLPAHRVTYLLRQLCHSLAEAHARGLVHRDVTPANVYVCRMGLEYDFVKVLDFGLVKFAPGSRSALLTADVTPSGTPAYMAPEVIEGTGEVDPRADVYSIGCLAYWMLTGHLVFEAGSSVGMLLQHLEAPPVPPSERSELPVPAEWDRIILACLEKDPARRPPDAGVLGEMLMDVRGPVDWSRTMAQRWWESHLPDVTHPHVFAVPALPPGRGSATAQPRALRDRVRETHAVPVVP